MAPWTTADIPDQRGRTVLVTGANSGLGARSAEALAGAGARVLMACRNQERAAAALASVSSVATAEAPEVVSLDLADLASVRSCAEDVARRTDRLDCLLNNAGVMALPSRRTADGFEMQLGTNHLGHFALTGRLLPVLLRAAEPRVVTTSSIAHRVGRIRWDDLNWERGYKRWRAYGQSKLANLLFAFELERRAAVAAAPLRSLAAHPGYAATHLQAAGPEMEGRSVWARAMDVANAVFAQSDAAGALPQLYAATMPDAVGGEYYGPDGPFEARGGPTRVSAVRAAYDPEAARRLWDRSEALTGVSFDWSSARTAQ